MLLKNQNKPPSLSDKGKWRRGKISDILEWDVSMEIVHASAIVQIWSEPSTLQTCNNRDYVERDFLIFVQSMISDSTINRLRPDLGFLS